MASKAERANKAADEMVRLTDSANLAELLSGLALEVQRKAVREAREDTALSITEHLLGKGDRSTWLGKSADECVLELLTEVADDSPITDPKVRKIGQRMFEDGEVSEDFRAGMAFVLALVGDVDGYDV